MNRYHPAQSLSLPIGERAPVRRDDRRPNHHTRPPGDSEPFCYTPSQAVGRSRSPLPSVLARWLFWTGSRATGSGWFVEDACRFARHVLVQELGVMALQQRGVQVFTAGGDELTATDDPSKFMVRQMMAAFAQFEKALMVAKLAVARKRKREATGKCEGRKGRAELRPKCRGAGESAAPCGCRPEAEERRFEEPFGRTGCGKARGRAGAALSQERLGNVGA